MNLTKTKLLLTFLISLSFSFGLTGITNACDYFVAQNKNLSGDGSGSSYTNRMSVATHNARTFSPGDTICLVDTISSQVIIPSSGTAGNRITYYGGYEGHKGVLIFNSSGGAIRGVEKSNFDIDSVEIKNGIIAIALLDNINNVTIKKCKIHDMGAGEGSKGIFISSYDPINNPNSNIIIGGANGDGNEVYNVGIDTGGGDMNLAHINDVTVSYNKCYGGNTDTGIDGVALTNCNVGLIEYNELYDHIKSDTTQSTDLGEDGIDLKGSYNITIRYNYIHGNRAVGIGVNNCDALGTNCSNIHIYNNLVHDHTSNIIISNLDNNCYVYNNVLYNSSGGHGISASTLGDNVQIYNNTIVNCHGDGTRNGILCGYGTNYIVKNNILYSDIHNDLIAVYNPSETILDNNQYYYAGGGVAKVYWDGANRTIPILQSTYSQEANGSEGNPKFTDIANNNFTLAEGSECINTGATLHDYANALDPINTNFLTFPPTVHTLNQNSYGAWEIGAFVYGGASTETAPVVQSFTANKTTINTNEPITFSYSVKDDDGDLKQVELYRKKDSGAWLPVSGQIHSISGAGPILGSFIDTPTIAGTYQYGMHVVDQATPGNIGYEPSEITVTVKDVVVSCDYFVAQSSAGAGNGIGYDNRMSVATHNGRTFSPGDTICLVDTISSQVIIPSSGTAGNRITYYGGYEGHEGVLIYSGDGAIKGEEKSYITINDIKIRDGRIGIKFVNNNHYIVIKKCEIHDMAVVNSKGITVTSNDSNKRNSNIIIGGAIGDGNKVYNVGVDTGGFDIGISHSDDSSISYNECYGLNSDTGIDGVQFSNVNNSVIEYNKLYNHKKKWSALLPEMGEDGIDLKGSKNITIKYNHIYGNRAGGILVNDLLHGTILCENISIYGNRIYNNKTNIVISNLYNNAYIYNNILYGNLLHSISAYTTGNNVQIYNNTIINSSLDINKSALFFGHGTNYIAKNNIFYSDTHENLVFIAKSSETILNNNRYYYTGGPAKIRWDGVYKTLEEIKALGQEANGSEGDPKFTDIANNNFTLAEGSECINTGGTLDNDYANALDPTNTNFTTFPPTVHTLNQNNYGTGWEIGAYVYGVATVPDPGPDPDPDPDPSLPTCAAPDICCPAGQLCSGGEGKNLANCDNTCCTGGGICDDPPASSVCQNKGYKCCSSCKLDHQPEYDSSCATGICCAVCTYAPPPPLGEVGPKNPLKTSDFAKIVENVLTWSLSIVGSLVLLVLIFGGVMYIGSAGDEQKVLNAKKIVTFAIMGLMIILGAYAIVKALSEVAA